MSQIIQQNQQTQLMMAQFTASSNQSVIIKKPTTEFPSWNDSKDTISLFLAQLGSYKSDPYFNKVTSWKVTLPADAAQSR